jgi:hypothetical protein
MEIIPGNTGLLWDPAALLPRPVFLAVFISSGARIKISGIRKREK